MVKVMSKGCNTRVMLLYSYVSEGELLSRSVKYWENMLYKEETTDMRIYNVSRLVRWMRARGADMKSEKRRAMRDCECEGWHATRRELRKRFKKSGHDER